MGFDGKGKIWFSGKLVDWNDANIHVGSHVIHYGSSVFEGIRMYNTPKGSMVFRLEEHIKRLFNSAKIYRMKVPFTFDEVMDACIEVLQVNGDHDAYIRPIVFRGYKSLGVDPAPCPVEVAIMTWHWGKYLGEEALEQGVDVCVSSWTRMAPNTFPALAKAGANYMNGQLIKQEAIANGYVEGIALDSNGYVSEGSGENIFVVYNGKMITPPLGNSVLPGITRDSIITIARENGIEVVEQMVPREMLYIADEVFFTGSAAEITPLRSIDKIQVGVGKCGPVTKLLQENFFKAINGEVEEKMGWLTPVKFG